MSNTVIKVENLSKQYRLGKIGTGSFSHDVNRWWHRIRGKEDPYLKIGETNDRTSKGESGYVWSLQDINFEIQKGDAVGIIGRNGAGKSTLLKILSRTTTPTTGQIRIRGKVASLLEVGTGFHPELTGRENIFLNGAILGMTKAEIRKKFDEIVGFAGVERYVDTPVKRYSSGMYVRLAFGVAAHLEPEILVVDEVLAVGDAEFQRKALGKMKDVSTTEGRTVLFVSHNMAAIENLCSRAIFLKQGRLCDIGAVNKVIDKYLAENKNLDSLQDFEKRSGSGKVRIENMEIFDEFNIQRDVFKIGEQIVIVFRLRAYDLVNKCNLMFSIYNEKEILVSNFSTEFSSLNEGTFSQKDQSVLFECSLHDVKMNEGHYFLNIVAYEGSINSPVVLDKLEFISVFSIEGGNPFKTGRLSSYGICIIDHKWKIKQADGIKY